MSTLSAHVIKSEPIPKARCRDRIMCRKIIITPLRLTLMYNFVVASDALNLVVELTPLETFS